MVSFGINFPQKGHIPLFDLYKNLPGEGIPELHFHAKYDQCSFKNVALWYQKSPKMVIFGKKFAPRGKF